jgi:predicted unusual protein kinase regulating ubiquinone biosynthesis (AarF/ABC1/UbiB family)
VKFLIKPLIEDYLFYTDIHYGNFKVDGKNLGVVDFGSVKYYGKKTGGLIVTFLQALTDWDDDNVYNILTSLGLVVSSNNKTSILETFKKLADPVSHKGKFKFGDTYRDTSSEFIGSELRKLQSPPDLIWFIRLLLGLVSMLSKMKAEVDIRQIILDLLPESVADERTHCGFDE